MSRSEASAADSDHQLSTATARLGRVWVDAFDSEDYLPALLQGLRSLVHIENLIVFSFRQGFAADLVFTNLDFDHLQRQMQPYTSGLYLLDPFYVADVSEGRTGLVRLDAIAPQDFRESEFFV